jgi:uncharacterized protein
VGKIRANLKHRESKKKSFGTSIDLNLKIEAREGSKFGRGIFALEDFKKQEVICQMQGPLITREEHIAKYGSLMFTDPLQIEEELYIDLVEPYRSFNHSCEPNAGMRESGVVFALSDIKKGEEVFFDYSTTCDDMWTMNCGCEHKRCRKIISKFVNLSVDLKEFYLKEDAVLQYIRSLYS